MSGTTTPPFESDAPTRPSATRFLCTFGYAWTMVGLFTGTLVLVLLVRGLVGLVHRLGWGQAAENRVLIVLILAFVATSFLLTRWLVRHLYRSRSPRARRVALAGLMLPGAMSMWAWSNPSRMLAGIAGGGHTTVRLAGGPEFVFGAYPDRAKLEELKREGITSVVSLQHPGVVVELQGIRAERTATAELGMQFVQAPMLPWVSDNRASLHTLRELALHGRGRYYVHCGLGRDRINVARRLVLNVQDSLRLAHGGAAAARVRSSADLKEALTFASRTTPFERGRPWRLAGGAWVIPYPNASEFFGYVLQGKAGTVFLVLDSTDARERAWLAQARTQLNEYAVPFRVVQAARGDTAALRPVADSVRAARGPVTVIVARTPYTATERGAATAAARWLRRTLGNSAR